MISYSENDIPMELAVAAHRGTSYVPERRGEQERAAYVSHIQDVVERFEKFVTDANREELTEALERYREGYAKRKRAHLQARTRLVSQFITGAGGWDSAVVRRQRKRGATADKRLEELLEYAQREQQRLARQFDPAAIARAPISSDDPEAVVRLREKIATAKSVHEKMKDANKVCRRKIEDAEKIEELTEIGFAPEQARELLTPDFAGRIGFAPYALSNNNANIRRMEKRVERILAEHERRESTPDEYEINGVLVIEDEADNRLRIVFDEKPPRAIRDKLKSRGFRWSPRNVAWQRQLNENARRAAREVLA